MSYREYAIIENPNNIPEHYAVKQYWDTAETGKVIQIDDQGRANPQFLTTNCITMVDKINNYKYFLQMENGKLISFCHCAKIEVTKLPDKIDYLEGQAFDPTGMVLTAVCEDGSKREITEGFTYEPFVMSNEFMITYNENNIGNIITSIINLNMTEFEPAIHLIDFDYVTNEDGTYTLTGWKQTLNGEISTEMVVPDSSLVRI